MNAQWQAEEWIIAITCGIVGLWLAFGAAMIASGIQEQMYVDSHHCNLVRIEPGHKSTTYLMTGQYGILPIEGDTSARGLYLCEDGKQHWGNAP